MPNPMLSTAELFHNETKYTADNLSGGPGLDWAKKPPVVKEYPGNATVDLPREAPIPGVSLHDYVSAALDAPGGPSFGGLPPKGDRLPLNLMALTMYLTNGVTAVAQSAPEPVAFRAAPSAGALYPTEIYLLVRDNDEVPDGLYNFHPLKGALQSITKKGEALFGPTDEWLDDVFPPGAGEQSLDIHAEVMVFFTTVFQRSAWRYGNRAYRRVMLDTGHVIGNFCVAAPVTGLATMGTASFVDEGANRLLRLDGAAEATAAVYSLVPRFEAADAMRERGSGLRSPTYGAAETKKEDLLRAIARDSSIRMDDAPMAVVQTRPEAGAAAKRRRQRYTNAVRLDGPIDQHRADMCAAIPGRRSTRRLSGDAVTLDQLRLVLEAAYRPDLLDSDPFRQPAFLDLDLLDTWVVAQKVHGLKSGVYWYSPGTREMCLDVDGDFRRETHFIALGQELASRAAAVVFHTCDLKRALGIWGDRAYRMIHLDAGHLGERMNLMAVSQGMGVSGIAGFLDDEVNTLLALEEQHVCVYMTCLGMPG